MKVNLAEAALVVAHPDDEILWFSSIVNKVSRIIICYGAVASKPERAQQRRNVALQYPLPSMTFLDLPEPGPVSSQVEGETLPSLIDILRSRLGGVKAVFTHNAWGEYGHGDHRRVHAAVRALQSDARFALYVSGYIGRRALETFDDNPSREIVDIVAFSVDRDAIAPILALYKSHSCWTWAANWAWPSQENFFRIGDRASVEPTAIPVQLIC